MKSDFCRAGAANQATGLYVGIFYTDSDWFLEFTIKFRKYQARLDNSLSSDVGEIYISFHFLDFDRPDFIQPRDIKRKHVSGMIHAY
jgi:hypothetical protein